MKVLVVDDKGDARYLLQALLSGHGHDVETASNGQEALDLAREKRPELIVSDILMPVMDGFQLCREIRADESLRDSLFVFYTATYVEDSDADFAMKIGADDFIRKPAEPEAFIARIESVLEGAETRAARQPELTQDAEVLRLYSERLVQKLEKRSMDLQEELARRQRAEETLRRHMKRLETLREIDIAILEAKSPESVAGIALESLQAILQSARASVTTFDLEKDEAKVLAVRTFAEPVMQPGEVYRIDSFGDVDKLAFGVARIIEDLAALETRTEDQELLLRAGIKSYVVVPLRARGELSSDRSMSVSLSHEQRQMRSCKRSWNLGISWPLPSGRRSSGRTSSGTRRLLSCMSRS